MRSLTFIRTIGAGAFGTVYLAELASGQGFRRQVAVKVLQDHHPGSEMFLSRIRDEARLLGLLQDDAILKVLDMARVDGRDAVLMEYIEGVDLESMIEAGHAPPPRALAALGSAVAGGLARAHGAVHPATGESLNVIHRDVKPANIMVTRSGGAKLLDFGVARARFDARESHTGQLVLGTLNYMAPEYIVTGEVSPAADVYGLALSLWQAATGEAFGQPKVRRDSHERRVRERLARLADTHAPLVPIMTQMLAWTPGDRPTAQMVEASLLDASDETTGAGLRSWARAAVPQVLQNRPSAADSAGLLGKSIQIAGADSDQNHPSPRVLEEMPSLMMAPPAPTPAARPVAPTPAPLPPGPDPVISSDGPAKTASPAVTPVPPAASPMQPSLLGPILKGLLVGVGFGILAVIGIIAFLLTR